MIRLLLTLFAMMLATAGAAQAAPKAAIFPFDWIDESLEGQYRGSRSDEAHRLVLASEELRKLAAHDAGYEVLDLGALANEVERSAPFYKCNGCEIDIARRIGADVAVTGTVKKISNLLLIFHIYVSDVRSGKLTRAQRIDIRGNTDESWLRGVRWLVSKGLAGG